MRKFGVRVSEDAPDAPLAQPEEQRKVNSSVTGSNPVEHHMHEWRNWKTRRAKDAVPERACEFDSRLVYQIQQGGRQVIQQPHTLFDAGSNPVPATIWENAGVWSNEADCKFVAERLRWFKSYFSHHNERNP